MRIQWLADRAGYTATFGPALRIGSEIDAWLASKETFDGYCTACRGIRTFKVFGGAWFGERPNLREGMVCTSCCLSNRQRFILAAAEETWPSPTPRLLLMERFSALYPALRGRYRNVVASEFLGPDVAPGAVLERRGERVRHENATNLSFSDHSLDGIVHNDVLEHIADYRRTFAEAFRALRPGGVLLFTCPFFAERDVHLVRAVVQP
ncbi:MAG: class I SAM-dependent methyltransferase, partial [Betaproteobacteria bacterium]